ncbi:MAG: hypothetical protein GSR79_10105 [Desulfurococcales archaeon]|nr:hypothetical protein [Desulfurococcales archaeon]
MPKTYRRNVKLYWVKNKSRGRTYLQPVIKIVLPKTILENLHVEEGENLVFDLELKEDGTIVLIPLYVEHIK